VVGARTQGADHRAGPPQQSDQGAAARLSTGDGRELPGSPEGADLPRAGSSRAAARPGLDHDFAAEETSQDGPHRRRGAGAGAPGLKARRAAGLLDGQAAQSRRGRSPAAGINKAVPVRPLEKTEPQWDGLISERKLRASSLLARRLAQNVGDIEA
jgi:hypothetical protein